MDLVEVGDFESDEEGQSEESGNGQMQAGLTWMGRSLGGS